MTVELNNCSGPTYVCQFTEENVSSISVLPFSDRVSLPEFIYEHLSATVEVSILQLLQSNRLGNHI